ncbi:MAG: hypothetical protein ACJARG_000425, partial [Arcticibacterium sp.]
SMAYTTFILGSTYLIVVYKLKLSVDLNGLVDKFLEKL